MMSLVIERVSQSAQSEILPEDAERRALYPSRLHVRQRGEVSILRNCLVQRCEALNTLDEHKMGLEDARDILSFDSSDFDGLLLEGKMLMKLHRSQFCLSCNFFVFLVFPFA